MPACDYDATDIDSCPPYANRTDTLALLNEVCSKDCTETATSGTLVSQIIEDVWGTIGAMPSAADCPILFVIVDCDIYVAVNDPVGCDLGQVPAVGGTGLDWHQL